MQSYYLFILASKIAKVIIDLSKLFVFLIDFIALLYITIVKYIVFIMIKVL